MPRKLPPAEPVIAEVDPLRSVAFSADYLDVSKPTIYRLMKDGMLPFEEIDLTGRYPHRRVRQSSLERLLRRPRRVGAR